MTGDFSGGVVDECVPALPLLFVMVLGLLIFGGGEVGSGGACVRPGLIIPPVPPVVGLGC